MQCGVFRYCVVAAVLMCCSECPAVELSECTACQGQDKHCQFDFPGCHFQGHISALHGGWDSCQAPLLFQSLAFQSPVCKGPLTISIAHILARHTHHILGFNLTKINLSVIKFKAKKRLMWKICRVFSKKPTTPSKDHMSLYCIRLYMDPVPLRPCLPRNWDSTAHFRPYGGDPRGVQSY